MNKTKTLVLLVLTLLIGSMLLTTSQASASVYAIVTASDCTEDSCTNFRVSFWGSTIKPYRSGTVCWKGRCLKSKSDAVGLFTADFNNIGPYKKGSKTTARLKYRGHYHNRKAWINCGC